MKIIGIAGSNGAGKDTLGDVLRNEYGFVTVSLSDILRKELTELGMPHTRENLSSHSKLLRDKYGDGAMADLTIQRNADADKLCITSIRTPGEVEVVQKFGGVVFWVDADPEVRYQRIIARGRDTVTDHITFEEFMKQQTAEMTPTKEGGGLNMKSVKEKSDFTIENNFSEMDDYLVQLRLRISEHI